MTTDLGILNAVLKEIYKGSLRKQLNDETKTLSRIEKTSDGVTSDVGGKGVVFPIHTRRNAGIGARREREKLPSAGNQGTAAAKTDLRYLYGSVGLTGQAIKLAKTDYQSFIAATDLELNGLKTDLRVDLNRQIYGDGTGKIGAIVSNTGTTIEVENSQFFQEGMILDAVHPTTGAASDTDVTVEEVDLDANEIVVDNSGTFTAGHFLVRAGNYDREWRGLGAIIDDESVLYGIDPANVSVWKSTIDRSVTERPVSEGLFTSMSDRIVTKGGGTPTAIYTTLGIRREYAQLLQQQRVFSNTAEFKGGFAGIAFTTDSGEIPMVAEKDTPKGTAYFVNEKAIKLYREADWDWMDYDGNKYSRVPNHDIYEATLFQYSELGTERRNAHGKIENISEPTL